MKRNKTIKTSKEMIALTREVCIGAYLGKIEQNTKGSSTLASIS